MVNWKSFAINSVSVGKNVYNFNVNNTDVVLDQDLSQAQLAQVEELLDIDIAYDWGARTVCKGVYNWPNETIGKQHKHCP